MEAVPPPAWCRQVLACACGFGTNVVLCCHKTIARAPSSLLLLLLLMRLEIHLII